MHRTNDLIILVLGWNNHPNQEQLPRIIGLGKRSIYDHLMEMQKKKLIIKNKTMNYYHLSESGNKIYLELINEISDYELTPERHGLSKICKLKVILRSIKKSETLAHIIRCYWNKESFNVIELLQKEEVTQQSSYVNRWIDEMLMKGREAPKSDDEAFRDYSMLGIKPGKRCDANEDVRTILTLADLKRRQGKVLESLDDFHCVLYRGGLESGYWIVGLVGWIYCINLTKGNKLALDLIEKELSHTVNLGHRAWLLYLKADILSDMDQYESANEFYKHSLDIMTSLKMDISMAEVRNSYGVNLFRKGESDKAEKQWIKCRYLCIKHKLPRMKSLAEINLSDIYSKRGNSRRAHGILSRAYQLLIEVEDHEGVSGVYFNQALVYLREGKIDKAHQAFFASEEFPLVYKQKMEERRKTFNRCLMETGHPLLRVPI